MPPTTTARTGAVRPWRRPAAVVVLGLSLVACAASGGRAPLAPPEVGACDPTGEAAGRSGTLSVAAAGAVEPLHAPVPTSDAERVLFRHLYGTLVEVDCRGRIRPGLADDWSTDRDGTRWTFRLDPDARFADGTPVTAGAVVTAWHQTDLAAGAGRRSPLDHASVSATSGSTAVVTLASPVPDAALFAEPRFAVTGAGGPSAWPAASGTHRPAAVAGPDLPGRTVGLVSRDGAPGGSSLRLVALGGAGSRDLLDAGGDLLVTRDPGAARYAGSLPGYRVHPLPWDRMWTLALPGRSDGGPASGGAGWTAVREGLAGEAIPSEARPAEGGLPWAACTAADTGTGGEPSARVGAASPVEARTSGAVSPDEAVSDRAPPPGAVVYPVGEPSGRALAARLAALAGGAGPEGEVVARELAAGNSALRTEGLGPSAFERSLRRGSAAAYLLALPRRPLAPCLLRREVQRRAPWLPADGRLVPLVETRPSLVVARDVAGLRLDWDGTPRLEGAGRR